MYYDEYFDEPSEFERQINEFKQSLINSVRQEHQEEIERLRKENAKLQGIKNRMTEIDREHREALNNLKAKERESDRKSLVKLLDSTKIIMYTPNTIYEEKPKCEKCNDSRKIEYKTPLGKRQLENCDCASKTEIYAPREEIRYEFSQSWRSDSLTVWYSPIQKNGDHVCLAEFGYSAAYKPYDGVTPYEKVERHKVMFESVEECQKYCDWLNGQKNNGGKC